MNGAFTPALVTDWNMVRLADAGWSISRIARHLAYHEQTVGKYITRCVAGSFGQLPDKPHPGRRAKVTEALVTALARLLDEPARTWTTPQLARWLSEHLQVDVPPEHLARLLQRRGFRWQRTKRSGAHKRKAPDLQAAKAAALEVLKKSGPER